MPDGPITDVNSLAIVGNAVAAQIKTAAGIPAAAISTPSVDLAATLAATKPGVERWPVKTGQDAGRNAVGKNVIAGHDLGAGIVTATVEELITAARPADMADPRQRYPAYQATRAVPVETTIWQVDVTIIAMKLEADGDYHLVLQGASGETMIAEVPTPTVQYVGDSPWLANMRDARQAIDSKLVQPLTAMPFVTLGDYAVPQAALPAPAEQAPVTLMRSTPGIPDAMILFKTQLPPTRARVTGVGFFDEVHGQTGVSQANGIELHPILKVAWL